MLSVDGGRARRRAEEPALELDFLRAGDVDSGNTGISAGAERDGSSEFMIALTAPTRDAVGEGGDARTCFESSVRFSGLVM